MATIQDEIGRLRQEWIAAGGNPATFNTLAQGETHEEHLEHIQAEIERMRRGE